MTAIEIIQMLMEDTGTTLVEMAEYADMGSKQGAFQALAQKDLKVSTFVKMLEAMGYQLIVQNNETDEDIIVDYD